MAIPRNWRGLVSALGLALALCCLLPAAAWAMCAPATEVATWDNLNPDADGIVRIEVAMNCQDLLVDGKPWPPGFPWQVRIFGRCGTAECGWGEVGGTVVESRASDEMYGRGRFIRAVFERERVEYRVYLHMDLKSPQLLHVYVYEDFEMLGHPNYGRHYWFRNAAPSPCTVAMTRYDWQEALNAWFGCNPDVQRAANAPG